MALPPERSDESRGSVICGRSRDCWTQLQLERREDMAMPPITETPEPRTSWWCYVHQTSECGCEEVNPETD